MGDTWILSHGCSSTVWISLSLCTDRKTHHVFTSSTKADNSVATALTWELLSTCYCNFCFFARQLWPGLSVVVLHVDLLVQQSIMTIKWLLSCLCSHTSLIWIKIIYTVRILNIFPGSWWKYRYTPSLLLLPMRPVYKHLHQGQRFQNQTALVYAVIRCFFCILWGVRFLWECCVLFDQMPY